MSNFNIKKVIGNQSHWTLNKELVRKIGLAETLVLQHLIDLNENLFENEFYQQIDRISDELSLGEWKVKECLKILRDLGCIDVVKKGLPAKNYYKINENRIFEVINTDQPLVGRKSPDLSEVRNEENDNVLNISEIDDLLVPPTSQVEITSLVSGKSAHKENKKEKRNNIYIQKEKNTKKEKADLASSQNNLPEIAELMIFGKCELRKLNLDEKYDHHLQIKIEGWLEAGGKDGHGKPIKNWKTKIKNIIPYLKPLSSPNTKQLTKTAYVNTVPREEW